jgi:transcriptional regulator GlxA family with amidase domain
MKRARAPRKKSSPGLPPKRPLRVAVVVFDGVELGELSIPCKVLGSARDPHGSPRYDVRVCSVSPTVESRHVRLHVPWRLSFLHDADMVIVPGSDDALRPAPAPLVNAVRGAFERGARVASIGTGAIVLAAAGIMNRKRATAHFRGADELAKALSLERAANRRGSSSPLRERTSASRLVS